MTNKEAIEFLSQVMNLLLASNSWLPSTNNPIKESFGMAINALTAQPEDDRLERCRFEYINACKTVTFPTTDTSKSDIYDAHAVIKALHPIFGDAEF